MPALLYAYLYALSSIAASQLLLFIMNYIYF
jgi:hypothetical protein